LAKGEKQVTDVDTAIAEAVQAQENFTTAISAVGDLIGSKLKLLPVGDRVVVEYTKMDSKTAGGIEVADQALDRKQGRIVLVGPGKKGEDGQAVPMYLDLDVEITWAAHGGIDFLFNGKNYCIIAQREIWAFLKDGKWRPYGDRALIRVMENEEFTKSGIALPDNKLDQQMLAEVLDVGYGKHVRGQLVVPPLAAGDIIMVRQYDGKELGKWDEKHKVVDIPVIEAVRRRGQWPGQGDTGSFSDDDYYLEPLYDRICIKVEEAAERISPGGIILPVIYDKRVDPGDRGIVMAKGPGSLNEKNERIPIPCEPGDAIGFRKYAGVYVKLADVEYKIIPEVDLLVVMKEEGDLPPSVGDLVVPTEHG
jgi:chaperonin GroES